ncbi:MULTISPECIES: hypothetical protein [Streptacidiphilus]|uniref:Secreted protein n=1 Tax=Streptacidiphilus cavernicola TaxID=3342716 RepID=A0ABV6UPU8_9ACTN|nr:hypothetical protein [Streptacidiphilus jeojiense]
MADAPRPLLLIDVDGPLNPYAAKPTRRPKGYRTHRMRPTGWDDPGLKPLRVWLNPAHGPALTALPYQLVWCTTWQAEANVWIGPQLGLPVLEHVSFQDVRRPAVDDGTYFKTHEVVRWAAGRPFAWVDDEVTDADREYVADVHPGPALLLTINPRIGLLPADFEQLWEWAESPRE